jgi:hypothetical protein
MKKEIGKIRIIFDLKNLFWKSEIGTFQSLDLEDSYVGFWRFSDNSSLTDHTVCVTVGTIIDNV